MIVLSVSAASRGGVACDLGDRGGRVVYVVEEGRGRGEVGVERGNLP